MKTKVYLILKPTLTFGELKMKHCLAENIQKLEIDRKILGTRTGRVVEVDEESGQIRVDYPGNVLGPIPAKFTHAMLMQMKNRFIEDLEVLLVFEDHDPALPVIIDVLYSAIDDQECSTRVLETDFLDDVEVDGKRLSFNAEDEIVLRCGKSSITLTRAGKIILRGTYLFNRSSGVNKIKGASIQIN